jgi:hypothetical protein
MPARFYGLFRASSSTFHPKRAFQALTSLKLVSFTYFKKIKPTTTMVFKANTRPRAEGRNQYSTCDSLDEIAREGKEGRE